LPGFVEQCLDDLVFGHGLDDFAADEDLAFAVAGGDAEVGFACFTETVDDATHDGVSTGGADSDTRMVSPIPSASSTPKATADLMVP
jgi:hypothetical protein